MIKKGLTLFALILFLLQVFSIIAIGTEKSVEFQTGKVVYDIEGDGANTLVFVHCWTCNKDFWNNQVEFFKSKFKVISIDLPGHGDSDK
ncbi:MAG: hypothetical protein JW737_04510, partial [Acidobacteria bacterium]|nr:hypothetical protein [Acidobacteriota bacterium]